METIEDKQNKKEQASNKLKTEISDLKKQISDLEEKLKIANEEKKYLSEACNSKDVEHRKAIKNTEETYNTNIQHLMEKHKKDIDDMNKQNENYKDSLKQVFEKQNKHIDRRENELQKLINFNDNVIKQVKSFSAISEMLQEYLLEEITSQKEEKGGK